MNIGILMSCILVVILEFDEFEGVIRHNLKDI